MKAECTNIDCKRTGTYKCPRCDYTMCRTCTAENWGECPECPIPQMVKI